MATSRWKGPRGLRLGGCVPRRDAITLLHSSTECLQWPNVLMFNPPTHNPFFSFPCWRADESKREADARVWHEWLTAYRTRLSEEIAAAAGDAAEVEEARAARVSCMC